MGMSISKLLAMDWANVIRVGRVSRVKSPTTGVETLVSGKTARDLCENHGFTVVGKQPAVCITWALDDDGPAESYYVPLLPVVTSTEDVLTPPQVDEE